MPAMVEPTPNDIAREQMAHASRLTEWQTRVLLTGFGLLVGFPTLGFALSIANDEPSTFVVLTVFGLLAFGFHRLWIRGPALSTTPKTNLDE